MKKITIIGGDLRLKILKEHLISEGYQVDSIGLYENDNGDIKSSSIIILPVPTTKDKINVFAPLTDKKIKLSDIEAEITSEQLILSCNYTFQNKKCIDYGALDSYALLNAVPTAEGAIEIAIQNTPFTLWNSTALVIGYGRVGKILADRLKKLGSDVTITARKPSDLALAEAFGFKYINTEHLNMKPLNFNLIFNTVDVKVIKDDTVKKINCDLIIDLSTYGGLDLNLASQYGIKTIKAPGLPAKVSPDTAAQILCKTVTHITNSYN